MKTNQVQGQYYNCKLLTKFFSTKIQTEKTRFCNLRLKFFSERNFKDSSKAPNFTLTL